MQLIQFFGQDQILLNLNCELTESEKKKVLTIIGGEAVPVRAAAWVAVPWVGDVHFHPSKLSSCYGRIWNTWKPYYIFSNVTHLNCQSTVGVTDSLCRVGWDIAIMRRWVTDQQNWLTGWTCYCALCTTSSWGIGQKLLSGEFPVKIGGTCLDCWCKPCYQKSPKKRCKAGWDVAKPGLGILPNTEKHHLPNKSLLETAQSWLWLSTNGFLVNWFSSRWKFVEDMSSSSWWWAAIEVADSNSEEAIDLGDYCLTLALPDQ